jgi:hypothetical protein
VNGLYSLSGEILLSRSVRELSAGEAYWFLCREPIQPEGYDEPIGDWAFDWSSPAKTLIM